MATFSTDQVLSLLQGLGVDQGQAQQVLGSLDQVDTDQHADLLNQLGVDPSQLASLGGGVQNAAGAAASGNFGGLADQAQGAADQFGSAASSAAGNLGFGGGDSSDSSGDQQF